MLGRPNLSVDRIDHRGFRIFRIMDALGVKSGLDPVRCFCGSGRAGPDTGTAAGELRVFRRVDPFEATDGDRHGLCQSFSDRAFVALCFEGSTIQSGLLF